MKSNKKLYFLGSLYYYALHVIQLDIVMASLNIRLSEEESNKLEAICKSLDRQKTYIVRKALSKYLQEIQEEIEDAQIVETYSKNKHRIFYTTEEVSKLIAHLAK